MITSGSEATVAMTTEPSFDRRQLVICGNTFLIAHGEWRKYLISKS